VSLAPCLEWGARRRLQNSNCDIRKGEGDTDPGITRLLKGSSEVRGPSGISVPVGGTTWRERAGQWWVGLAGGTNSHGATTPGSSRAQGAEAALPGLDADSLMTSWRDSNFQSVSA
jgi:hypothetical protein